MGTPFADRGSSEAVPQLATEQRNPRTADLDRLSPDALVRALHAENHLVAVAVDRALPVVVRAVEVIAERLSRGGRLFYVGAGTSGRLGVLDASECPPTFGVDPELVQGIIAGGDVALRLSSEGTEDDPSAGAADVRDRSVGSLDVVVGIAASGRTPYTIGALRAARSAGAYAIALVNVDDAAMTGDADLTIAAVTGPEAVTGSTRLKAGTAQKMVLNLLSTASMVRLGKTYGNLMVDVRASNRKLRERAVRIAVAATGAPAEDAASALECAGWNAKLAIVMLRSGLGRSDAEALLASCGGHVSAAIGSE